jgi:hypothetical protein
VRSGEGVGQVKEIWVLIGHYKRKPSEILGVYEHYERGIQALNALAFIGAYNEVALTRTTINRDKKYTHKKVKS